MCPLHTWLFICSHWIHKWMLHIHSGRWEKGALRITPSSAKNLPMMVIRVLGFYVIPWNWNQASWMQSLLSQQSSLHHIQFLRLYKRYSILLLYANVLRKSIYTLLGLKNLIFILNIKITQRTSSRYNTFPILHIGLFLDICT